MRDREGHEQEMQHQSTEEKIRIKDYDQHTKCFKNYAAEQKN